MDLTEIPIEDLRAEINRRKEIEDEEHRRQMAEKFPCPECGAPPKTMISDAVVEHRSAPVVDGQPMPYLPYDSALGRTVGFDYEVVLTCENGHETVKRFTRFFDEPHVGPPMLPRRG